MASLPQSLAEWRGREGVGLDQLAAALRIEAATLERIEAGEVNPGSDLRERIGRTIEHGFRHGEVPPASAAPCADPALTGIRLQGCYSCASDEFPCAPGPLPAQARDGNGAAADGEAAAAPNSLLSRPTANPATFPAWGAWLAKRDGEEWMIELMGPSGHVEALSIAAASAIAVKLNQLVAAHDAGPAGFAKAFS